MNKISLQGILSKEPIIRRGRDDEVIMARCSIFTVHEYDNREHKTFHNLVMFGNTADGVSGMKVGGNIHAEGRIQTRKRRDGSYVTEVVVEKLQYQQEV